MIKLRLYDLMERLNMNVIGPMYRRMGKNMALGGLEM
jgi:hypothetical protein